MRIWHLLLISIAILPHAYCIQLTGLYGRIASPGFPKPYSNELNVTWNIQVPEGHRVKIYFTYFNLERSFQCEYDYVKLTSQGKDVAHLCGKESTDTERAPEDTNFYSLDNKMMVIFRSDYSNEKEFTGFEAIYVAEDINECEKQTVDKKDLCEHSCHNYIGGYFCSCPPGFGLHTDKKTCIVQCKDETSTTSTSGLTRQLSFPKPTSCSYTIQEEEGLPIILSIINNDNATDVLCPNDQLQITVNGKDTALQCGDALPSEIDTRVNKVDIVYTTDGLGNHTIWNLRYSVKAVDCGPPEDIESGTFSFVTAKDVTTYNSIIQYNCKDFYVIKEDLARYRCGAEGKWEEISTGRKILPVCEPDCGKTVPHATQRIFGGSLAKLGQFPWQVFIKGTLATGGGTLLYDRWIITAAHLAHNIELDGLRITMGMILNDIINYKAEPEAIYVHPSYKHLDTYNHDIALIKLKDKVPINETILGICLPTKDDRYRISENEDDHHVGQVAGWGVTKSGSSSRYLRFVEVDIINHAKCARTFSNKLRSSDEFTRNMICAGGKGKDSCSGDGGGSLSFFDGKTKRWFIGGIVSWGLQCGARDSYGVYTKVSNYLDWIHNTIQSK